MRALVVLIFALTMVLVVAAQAWAGEDCIPGWPVC